MGDININSQDETSIGGDVVGRDKITHGDQITIDGVGDKSAVAAGRDAKAVVATQYVDKINIGKVVIHTIAGRWLYLVVLLLVVLLLLTSGIWYPLVDNIKRIVEIKGGVISPVTSSNAIDVVYRMVESQLQLSFDCPKDLKTSDWVEFKAWLNKLDFEDLPSPEKADLKNYKNRFVRLLDKPPSIESKTAKFDCGVAEGELILELRPVLVDFEINEEKANSDGKHLGVVKGIRNVANILKLQYLLLLGVDSNRLENVQPETRAFFEHLVIWMVLYFDQERTPTVIKAQGAFLALSETDLNHLANRDEFIDIHKKLALMSHAMTRGDKVDVGSYGAQVLIGLSHISQSAISEDKASYIGGERFVQIVKAMYQYEQGGGGESASLEQLVNMFRTMIPKNK